MTAPRSTTRSTAASARRRRRSATTASCSKNTSSRRAISRCRCSATATATSSICSSATARSSAATRRSSRKPPRRAWTRRRGLRSATPRCARRKAVDYVGAGTIEFIADASEGLRADRIWFMEMNTRLQVEHPVTEEITGVDLVEWQLRVASGEALPKRQDELSDQRLGDRGAACMRRTRRSGFLPSVGRLEHFDLRRRCDRIDETGVEEGDEISPFYDPMIAKLIAHGDTRARQLTICVEMLDEVEVWPVRTNAGFLLQRACTMRTFAKARLDTGFIERKADDARAGDPIPTTLRRRCGMSADRRDGAAQASIRA